MLACKLCGFTGDSDQYCLNTKPFYEVKGVKACVCTPWGLPDQYYWILCVMSYKIIYGLGVEI